MLLRQSLSGSLPLAVCCHHCSPSSKCCQAVIKCLSDAKMACALHRDDGWLTSSQITVSFKRGLCTIGSKVCLFCTTSKDLFLALHKQLLCVPYFLCIFLTEQNVVTFSPYIQIRSWEGDWRMKWAMSFREIKWIYFCTLGG